MRLSEQRLHVMLNQGGWRVHAGRWKRWCSLQAHLSRLSKLTAYHVETVRFPGKSQHYATVLIKHIQGQAR